MNYRLHCDPPRSESAGRITLRAAGPQQATLDAPADAFACRLSQEPAFQRIPGEPEPFAAAPGTLLQTAIGPVSTRLCNGLYAPEEDAALLITADELELEQLDSGLFRLRWDGPLTLREIPGYMRDLRHLDHYVKLDRSRLPRPLSGWCSWYSYYQTIDSAELRRNVDFLARTLLPYGLEWIQLDDGWHGRGEGHPSNRDFFTVCQEKFPEGMRAESDYIRSRGFRPGLWCMPFSQSAPPEELPEFCRDMELYIWKPSGESICRLDQVPESEPDSDRKYDWFGMYAIDPSGPAGEMYLEQLTRRLVDEFGFDFLKLDGQGRLVNWFNRYRRQLADPSRDGAATYRHGLEIMRAVLGADRFLLNCAQSYVSCGLCEMIRTGPDVEASWRGIRTAADSTYLRLYLNTIAFYTDPDVVCVRAPLTLEEARIWVTLIGLSGQMVLLSDFMPELPPERLELLQKILPVADIHPVDLFPMTAPEAGAMVHCRIDKPEVGSWSVAALINFSGDELCRPTLTAIDLGLNPQHDYLVFDFWEETLLGEGPLTLPLTIGCHCSRLLGIHRRTGVPQFLASSRHLTMGATDVIRCHWQDGVLNFAAELTAGAETVFYFYIPEGWQCRSRELQCHGRLAILRATGDGRKPYRGRFTFRRAPGA